jgi:hypothetical protein
LALVLCHQDTLPGTLGFAAFGGVEDGVVIELVAEKALDQNWPGDYAREAVGVVPQGGFNLGEHARGAGGQVDALDFGSNERGGDFDAVDPSEHLLFVLFLPNQPIDQSEGHALFERGLLAQAVIVIDALDSDPIPAQGRKRFLRANPG